MTGRMLFCHVFMLAAILHFAGPVSEVRAQATDQAAVRDFNATAALQNSGFYDRATAKWADFVKKYPNDKRLDRVHYYLGICQLHTKKYPDAVKTFQTVLQKWPTFASADGAQYNLSMAMFQQAAATPAAQQPAAFKAAAAAFGLVPQKYVQSKHAPKALYFQGESLFTAADVPGAIAAWQKLIASYKTSPLLADAYYNVGVAQQDLGQDAEAAATFDAFLKNPAFAMHDLGGEIRLRSGMSLFNMKKFDDAEKQFAAVVVIPKFALADFALLRQGQCRVESGKMAEAAPLFVELLAKFPQSTYLLAAQLAAGKCYYMTDNLTDAQKQLTAVVAAKKEESAEAAYWLGRTLLKMKKAQEAFTALDAAVKVYTTGEFAPYLQLARVDALYDLDARRKETPPLYEAFAKQFPDHPLTAQSVYMAALAALGQEQHDVARRHADAFLANAKFKESDLFPAVLYIAGEGYLLANEQQGGADLAKAEQLYRQLIIGFPEHARAARSHLRIGWCLFQTDKHQDSVTYLKSTAAKLTDPAHKAESLLLIGRGQSVLKQDQQAVVAYDGALKAKADWTRGDEVLLAWAHSLRVLTDLPGAAQKLAQLRSSFPASAYIAQAAYEQGEIAQEQKNYDGAIAFYNEVVQKFATSDFVAPARYGLGASYLAKEDYQNAVAPLTQLLTSNKDAEIAPRGQYLRGLAYQRLDQFDPALKDFQAFIATKPTGDELYDARYAAALCQVGLKQYDPAAAAFKSLLTDKPDYAGADKVYYELGHAMLLAMKSPEAAAAFRTLGEKYQTSPLAGEAWFHVGRFHEETADGLEDEAKKQPEFAAAEKALATGLGMAKAADLREKIQYKLGDMLFRQKKYAPAATTLLAQVQEHPQGELLGPGRFLAAECLFRQDQFDKALPLFVQVAAAKVEKYHAQSLYRAGTCAGNLKAWADSQKHYTALIAQFPKYEQISDARYGLGLAMQSQNKLAEARQVYELVTQETEAEAAAKARFMIGEISFFEKKYAEAIEHFLLVAVGYPYKDWQAMAQFETGRCFIELDQKDQAIRSLKTVVDKYSDHAKAKEAATLIANLNK